MKPSALLVSFALIALAAWAYFFGNFGRNIQSQCQVNGLGEGHCSFTNTGWSPGSMCVTVQIKNKKGEKASSPLICSGRVWPDDTTSRDVSIILPSNHCGNSIFGDWQRACELDIVNGDPESRNAPLQQSSEKATPNETKLAQQHTADNLDMNGLIKPFKKAIQKEISETTKVGKVLDPIKITQNDPYSFGVVFDWIWRDMKLNCGVDIETDSSYKVTEVRIPYICYRPITDVLDKEDAAREKQINNQQANHQANADQQPQGTTNNIDATPDQEAYVDISSKNMNPPRYPPAAARAGIEGTVILIVNVDANGDVTDVSTEKSSGNDDIDRSAMEAARRWRFNPGVSDGKKVAGRVRVPIDFSLSHSSQSN